MDRPRLPRLVLEITPPARPRPHVLVRRASLLAPAVTVVNVISRPDRWPSLEAAIALRTRGLDPVWHVANRGRALAEIEGEIDRAAEAGLRRALCLRGEHKAAESPDEPRIREVVARIRSRLPGASIGVTFNHHVDTPRARANLWRKLDAGADFVQTQVSFGLRGLRGLADEIRARHPGVGVVPMLLPVRSPEAALRAARRLGIPLDQGLYHDLERGGAAAGWASFDGLLGTLLGDGAFAGVALMTPIDPAADFAARLRETVAALPREPDQ